VVGFNSGLPIVISLSERLMFTLGTRAEYLGRDSVWVNEPRILKSSFTFHFTSSEGRKLM
jgi:hypothetical protein